MITIQMHPDPDQLEIMESMLAENPLWSFSLIAGTFQCQLIPPVFCCTKNRVVSGYSALLKVHSLILHPKILVCAPIALVPRFQSGRGHMDLIRIRLLLNPCSEARV